MYGLQIFSLFHRLSLYPIGFSGQSIFSLIQSYLSTFTFIAYVFGAISKNHYSDQCQGPFPPIFSSRSFVVSTPKFKPLIHLSFFLYLVWDKGSISFFYTGRSRFPSAIYWKDCSFPFCVLDTLVKDQLSVNSGFISGLSILWQWFLYVTFCQYYTVLSLNYYFTVLCFEIRKREASNFVTFQDCHIIWVS
jgi:hypothetical protein